MKLLSFLFLFTFANAGTELALVRQNYISAATSAAGADTFRKSFENVNDGHGDATLVAYKAASIVLMAKYEEGVFAKMRFFNRGKDLLEATIKKSPDNYEARLIRLNIQDNVPWITGYTSKIREDKAFLMKYFAQQPYDLRLFTQKYVSQCDAFSDKEKALFKL